MLSQSWYQHCDTDVRHILTTSRSFKWHVSSRFPNRRTQISKLNICHKSIWNLTSKGRFNAVFAQYMRVKSENTARGACELTLTLCRSWNPVTQSRAFHRQFAHDRAFSLHYYIEDTITAWCKSSVRYMNVRNVQKHLNDMETYFYKLHHTFPPWQYQRLGSINNKILITGYQDESRYSNENNGGACPYSLDVKVILLCSTITNFPYV